MNEADRIAREFRDTLAQQGKKLVVVSTGQSDIDFHEEDVDGETRAYWELHSEGFEYAPNGSILSHTETTAREYVPKVVAAPHVSPLP